MKAHVITLARLDRALARVRRELNHAGLWDERLADVEVYLVPSGFAYGWQHYGGDGSICIPALSVAKLRDWWSAQYTSLADVLRHEYAHAFADTHRSLVRGKAFREAFSAAHADERELDCDPHTHVSSYGATNASEDFAETFMLFLRHGGRLPDAHASPAKKAKWRFLRGLASGLRR